MEHLLICKCGDCAHWEIGMDENGHHFIKCVSCGDVHRVIVTINKHDNIHFQNAELPHKQKPHHGKHKT